MNRKHFDSDGRPPVDTSPHSTDASTARHPDVSPPDIASPSTESGAPPASSAFPPVSRSSEAPGSGAKRAPLADPRSPIDASSPRDTPCGFSTLAVHAGEARQKPLDSITDPIVCASTFTFTNTQSVLDYIDQNQSRGEYARYGNPCEAVVERKLAALDNGEEAVLFASGMAALVGLLTAKLNAGDEVIFFDECYHRSREFCTRHLARFGVVTHTVKTADYEAMEAAINGRTRLLISESPTNPHLSIVDLERFVELGRRYHVETLIDATLATPYNVRPLDYGVDFVLHSATKYLGGHNDLLAGVVTGSREQLEPVRALRGILGSINSPHNIYLLERGLKTFDLRMQRHNQNGQRIAEFLASHPAVARVLYPGLPSHPYHQLATRTMRGFGGLVTFELRHADWQQTARVVDATRIARLAPSLGGVESLIEQPLVMSYFKYTPEERQRFGISDNMIRLACGIEDTEDLIADLDQALHEVIRQTRVTGSPYDGRTSRGATATSR